MAREIKLDGGEISVLKAIGLSGSPSLGRGLVERSQGMETAEFLDTLNGLLSLGYVISNKVNVRSLDDIKSASFRVNPAHAQELRTALHPGRNRDQRQERRRRRS